MRRIRISRAPAHFTQRIMDQLLRRCSAFKWIALLALVAIAPSGAIADDAPEPPDLSGIDLAPVLDVFADIKGDLETALDAMGDDLQALESRAADVVNNPQDFPLICIVDRGSVFLGFFAGSFFAPPGADLLFDLGSYGADIALKFCRPQLAVSAPDAGGFDPADDGGEDECRLEVEQVTAQTNTTFLVIPRGGSLLDPRLTDWGPLGTPSTTHVNSDVDVRLLGDGDPDDGQYFLRLGNHILTWEAVTTISPLDLVFLYIPGLPESAKKYLGANGKEVFEALIDIAVDIALFELSAGESENDFLRRLQTGQPNSAPTYATTNVVVWDLVPPEISSTSGNNIIQFEGLEPGGASIKTQRDRLRPMITISDRCRDENELTLLPPTNFWPVGEESDAVWTVLDPGPNQAGERNSASVTQRVRVVDTLPPNVLAPPSQVTEIEADEPVKFVQIGAPRTFDFVDPAPQISATFIPSGGVIQLDGGFAFPPGVTQIEWCARDGSGNDSCANGVDPMATQIINVKEAGTNSAPLANPQVGAQAIAAGGFAPVEIIVSGNDPDFDARSGRFDPLGFAISKAPENGFFVAPLLPYFVDDYRIPFQNNIDRCTPNRPPEVIVEPQSLRVAESGLMYLLTAPLEVDPGCNPQDPFVLVPTNRLSIFDTNGDSETYITGRDLPRANDLFGFYHDELRNRIMYTYFSSAPQILVLDALTLETQTTYTFAEPRSGIRKAVLDGNGILYTSTGFARVDVWDTTLAPCTDNVCDLTDAQIGEFAYLPDELGGGGTGVPIDMALTSDDSLVVGTFFHIYRFDPATRDSDGTAVPGALQGFLGACSAGPGCDLVTQATRGFSCTHDTCTALYPPVVTDGPGQLNSAASIALDPNDVLYVADRNNRRVQRFTSEGFFAGTAQSSCAANDFDRCLQQGFVLANFGRPDTISVNSKHLYVLDENPALELVHVFQTSVLTPISDSEATITYQSDSGFDGTDFFEFVVSDGLETSRPAVVEIDVTISNRNAPTAGDLALSATEDQPLELTLAGTDLDFGPTTLAYQIIDPPLNGALSGGSLAQRTYTPAPNYSGLDRFTYRVDDGDFVSEPATVTITIESVGDTPTIDLPDRFEAPLNEPGYFSFSFADPDPDSEHTVEIDWGDGTFEREGSINPDGTATGPILSESTEVTGFVYALHEYSGRPREVEMTACILPPTTIFEPTKGGAPPPVESICATAIVEVGIKVFANGFE